MNTQMLHDQHNEWFLKVANKRNWKLPINAEIEIQPSQVQAVVDAIKWKTESRDIEIYPNLDEPTVNAKGFSTVKVRFTAEGWYNAHGCG